MDAEVEKEVNQYFGKNFEARIINVFYFEKKNPVFHNRPDPNEAIQRGHGDLESARWH